MNTSALQKSRWDRAESARSSRRSAAPGGMSLPISDGVMGRLDGVWAAPGAHLWDSRQRASLAMYMLGLLSDPHHLPAAAAGWQLGPTDRSRDEPRPAAGWQPRPCRRRARSSASTKSSSMSAPSFATLHGLFQPRAIRSRRGAARKYFAPSPARRERLASFAGGPTSRELFCGSGRERQPMRQARAATGLVTRDV